MDTARWPQEIVVKPIEEIVVANTCPRPPLPPPPPPPPPSSVDQRKPRPQKEQALNCPRCHSTNTKFCYYNNYSLTQPRYFCKTCRRYWTEGGSLRNIPVGGGSRKNKRSSYNSSSSSSSSSSIIMPPPPKNIKLNIIPGDNDNNNPSKVVHEGQDLNLSSFPNISELIRQNNNNTVASASASSSSSNTSTTSHHHNFSALELITGITTTSTSRGFNNTTFMPMPSPSSSSSSLLPTHDDPNIGYTFPLLHHDFKPSSLNFSLDGIGSSTGFGSLQETTSGSGRILFPFEDLKHASSTTTTPMDQNNNNKEQQQEDQSPGYWTGMLGGGSW